MIDRLKNWWVGFVQIFKGQDKEVIQEGELLSESAEASKEAKRQQNLILAAIFGAGLVGTIGWSMFSGYRASTKHKETKEAAPFKIEVASTALDPDKMWRNLFEDKLTLTKEETDKKLELIETSLSEASLTHQNQLKAEVDKLKAQLQYLTDEQESSRRDLSNIKIKSESQEEYKPNIIPVQESHIEINHMGLLATNPPNF